MFYRHLPTETHGSPVRVRMRSFGCSRHSWSRKKGRRKCTLRSAICMVQRAEKKGTGEGYGYIYTYIERQRERERDCVRDSDSAPSAHLARLKVRANKRLVESCLPLPKRAGSFKSLIKERALFFFVRVHSGRASSTLNHTETSFHLTLVLGTSSSSYAF